MSVAQLDDNTVCAELESGCASVKPLTGGHAVSIEPVNRRQSA